MVRDAKRRANTGRTSPDKILPDRSLASARIFRARATIVCSRAGAQPRNLVNSISGPINHVRAVTEFQPRV